MEKTITLKIRYKPKTKIVSITIPAEKPMGISEIAEKLSNELTDMWLNYQKFQKIEVSERMRKNYYYGQYKLLYGYLENRK